MEKLLNNLTVEQLAVLIAGAALVLLIIGTLQAVIATRLMKGKPGSTIKFGLFFRSKTETRVFWFQVEKETLTKETPQTQEEANGAKE